MADLAKIHDCVIFKILIALLCIKEKFQISNFEMEIFDGFFHHRWNPYSRVLTQQVAAILSFCLFTFGAGLLTNVLFFYYAFLSVLACLRCIFYLGSHFERLDASSRWMIWLWTTMM